MKPHRVPNNKDNCSTLTETAEIAQNPPIPEANQPEGSSLKIREWMTTEQAANYLGLTVGALMNMTSNGQVPYHKLGRRNRYLVVELRRLLFSQKRGCHGY